MIEDAPYPPGESEAPLGSDTPLRVGGSGVYKALVRPHVLYVEYDCSRARMVELGNPGTLLREALERNPGTATTSGEIFDSVPQLAKEFAAVEAHERDHVRRLLSTSFGLLCHAFRTQQLIAARAWVIDAAQGAGGLTLPFDLMSRQPDLGTPAYRALTCKRLVDALETQLEIAAFQAAEPALAGWTANGCEYMRENLPGAPAYSTLRTTNGGRAITAQWLTSFHLLELFGACEEGNRLISTGSDIEPVKEKLEMNDRWYTLPLLVWLTHFPTAARRPKPLIRPPRAGEPALSFFRAFPLELFIAADLALWPPFTPDGLASAHRHLDWTDVNPAFRFNRILTAYRHLGIEPGDWPEDDLDVVVPDLQRRVCELFGWPMPADLAGRWLDHLSSRNNTWFLDPAIGGFRYTTTLELLALRRDRPGDIVVNNVDFQAERIGRSAGWITVEENNQLMPTTLSPEADREATEFLFHLNLFTPALLGPTKGSQLGYLMRYPRQTRMACVDAFDTWGGVMDGWPSDDFRRQATAILGLG